MGVLFLIVFFLVAFLIVALVLLQEGKGGGLTGMSTGMDGVMGAKNPLRKMTAYLFVVFVLLAIGINYYFHRRGDVSIPEGVAIPEARQTLEETAPFTGPLVVPEAAGEPAESSAAPATPAPAESQAAPAPASAPAEPAPDASPSLPIPPDEPAPSDGSTPESAPPAPIGDSVEEAAEKAEAAVVEAVEEAGDAASGPVEQAAEAAGGAIEDAGEAVRDAVDSVAGDANPAEGAE